MLQRVGEGLSGNAVTKKGKVNWVQLGREELEGQLGTVGERELEVLHMEQCVHGVKSSVVVVDMD